MKWLFGVIIILSVFEITGMLKKGQKKEIVLFICFALITLIFGCFYLTNPYRESLSFILLNFFRIRD